jgi:hypothetical protein
MKEGKVKFPERAMEKTQLQREKVKKCSEEPRSRSKCKGGKDEFTREISRLVLRELMDGLAIRAELTTSLGLVRLVWLARGAINPARLSRRTTITVRGV